MTPSMTQKEIERALEPIVKRIEALEAEIAARSNGASGSPVGWGGHLPGKIEP